jgi:hypothetical protein
MTPFHPQQSNRGRSVRKNANANTFNFTSQIAPPICAVMHTEHDKSDTTIFKSLCKRMAVSKCFYRVEALPLRQRRKWRDPRCDAYAVPEANNLTHMGASFAANFNANLNATPSAALAANQSAAGMPNLI